MKTGWGNGSLLRSELGCKNMWTEFNRQFDLRTEHLELESKKWVSGKVETWVSGKAVPFDNFSISAKLYAKSACLSINYYSPSKSYLQCISSPKIKAS